MMPIVTNETIDSTLATLCDDREYAKNTIKELRENNPVLYSLIETVGNQHNEQYAKGYIVGASQFYSLLKRQLEADVLDSYL
tara:strand:- start:546 stop:791 length:246 start_codon:yes stop_codon:yes gene_type:complete